MIIALDGVLLPFSLWAAFGFRLGILDPTSYVNSGDLFAIIGLSFVALIFFKLYRLKLNAFDLWAISKLARFAFLLIAIAGLVDFFAYSGVPRSVPILYGASFFLFAIVSRIVSIHIIRALSRLEDTVDSVAIYGAGAAGIQLALALKHSQEVRPYCFVDDNPSTKGMIVAGLTVCKPSVLEGLVKKGIIQRVLIAIPSLTGGDRSRLVSKLSALGCEIQVIPSYVDLISGRNTVSDLRQVSPDELLNRNIVDLDNTEVKKTYADRSVMVTGAGGSIGSELCKQLLSCKPRKLVMFERSEHALYEIDNELRAFTQSNDIEMVRCLGSVTDRSAVDAAIRNHDVEVILHAAAYKHVPMVEENEVEGARNNIIGTFEVADAARAADIDRFILISTDKAVRPTNVMGATKRLAEQIIHDTQLKTSKTKYSMVRFGNVLGSSGSVVPLFNRQIARGGPVTVTHADVTRYFMTIPEAASLVLIAGSHSSGDDLFVLDMGKPVKIIDLARKMIELAGRTICDGENPNGDIRIEVTGLRPGEKLYEELLVDNISKINSPHEKIFRANEKSLSQADVSQMYKQLNQAVQTRDAKAVRDIIEKYVEQAPVEGARS
ncbi:nucleoside-diphosphate sugar epimerase/dehydratase [Ahrensia kielensis]|uniref:Nucleoside-diphosphate sugar epimerase/dehydratase n=1 Tax=Ahrensia kielensis TaxID=76980 RepID=A0ABU9T817_9HYPH